MIKIPNVSFLSSHDYGENKSLKRQDDVQNEKNRNYGQIDHQAAEKEGYLDRNDNPSLNSYGDEEEDQDDDDYSEVDESPLPNI